MKRLLLTLFLATTTLAQTVTHQNVITWTVSPTSGVTGYNVYRAPVSCSGTFVKITATPTIALTFTDTGLAAAAVNCYYITAVAPGGESAPSAAVLVTSPTLVPSTVPQPPGTSSASAQ